MHGPVPPKVGLWAFLAQTSVQPGGLQPLPPHTLLKAGALPSALGWVRDVEATESRSSFTLSVHSWGSRSRRYVRTSPGQPSLGDFCPTTLPALVALPAPEPQEEGGQGTKDAPAENPAAAEP